MVDMSADLEELTDRLGHSFGDRSLLVRALTHSSWVTEHPSSKNSPRRDNEQLEFLGDSVLGFVISDYLVKQFPLHSEGQLTVWKAHLVRASHLYQVARNLQLGNHLVLGRGEEVSGGREKRALLSDAVEALIAALYLDGGLDVARRFIVDHVVGAFGPLEDGTRPEGDHKTVLLEMAFSMKLPPPKYVVVLESGPEHSKTFTVEARLGKDWSARATGSSKKIAGQEAARILLQNLEASSAN
jgi:ribonuclease-3